MNPTMTRNSSNTATSKIRLRTSIDVLPHVDGRRGSDIGLPGLLRFISRWTPAYSGNQFSAWRVVVPAIGPCQCAGGQAPRIRALLPSSGEPLPRTSIRAASPTLWRCPPRSWRAGPPGHLVRPSSPPRNWVGDTPHYTGDCVVERGLDDVGQRWDWSCICCRRAASTISIRHLPSSWNCEHELEERDGRGIAKPAFDPDQWLRDAGAGWRSSHRRRHSLGEGVLYSDRTTDFG
jgi:hypothetical protein